MGKKSKIYLKDWKKPADRIRRGFRWGNEEERSQICCREEGEHDSDEEAEYHGFLSRLRRKIARIEVYKGSEREMPGC